MSRELEDWLSGYLEYTENSEPPTIYHKFCGLSVLAGVLQRRVYLKWSFEEIFPNLYVILVGPSGRTRKGVALNIAKSFLKQVPGISVAPESSSGREAMIQAMKRAYTNFEDPSTGKVSFHCSLSAFSEELSVFLGQGDIKYLANLTDWYESKQSWEYETIGRGVDSLEGLCFNMAGGTAPDWIQSMLPYEAIGGGFTARVIFVVAETKGKTVPKHTFTSREISLQDMLTRDLERISQMAGPMLFTSSGERAYIEWYREQDRLMRAGETPIADSRFASYCERRATHIRKIMLSLSASRGSSLQLDECDFDRALALLTEAEREMHKTFGGLGKSRTSEPLEMVMTYMKKVGFSTRKSLLGKFYRDIDAQTLQSVEQQLEQMKVMHVRLLPDQGDKSYTWIGDK